MYWFASRIKVSRGGTCETLHSLTKSNRSRLFKLWTWISQNSDNFGVAHKSISLNLQDSNVGYGAQGTTEIYSVLHSRDLNSGMTPAIDKFYDMSCTTPCQCQACSSMTIVMDNNGLVRTWQRLLIYLYSHRCSARPQTYPFSDYFCLHKRDETIWCDVMWCDVMWCDVMWCVMIWCDMIWYDMICTLLVIL